MASLQDIRRRIRSVKNTQQVTKAMKMISAVKLRKSQERLVSIRPFAKKINSMTLSILSRSNQSEATVPLGSAFISAFLSPREEKKVHMVLVASDKGLCGGFNANLLKKAHQVLSHYDPSLITMTVVGRRASEWAKKRKIVVQKEYLNIALGDLEAVAREISTESVAAYQDNKIDALYVIYNHFHSAVNQEPSSVRLFPMEAVSPSGGGVELLLEPDPLTALEVLLPRFVETEILAKLLESSASEYGARMAAMDKATNNAGEMIDKLTLTMNKIRQASITNQIIEIVSGANA